MRGLTIIELLLVLGIMMVLGGMAAVVYGRFINQNALSNVTDQLVGSLRKAQMYAASGRENNSWGVYFGSQKITMFAGADYLTRVAAFDEVYEVPTTVRLSGMSQIVFGRPAGVPGSTATVVIESNGSQKTVRVNELGVVSQ